MGLKRTPADIAFSKVVRARDNYTCQRCFKQPEHPAGLHCSHHFSRTNRTIRFCLDNAIALCFSCHEWFGGNPADSSVWLEQTIGEDTIEILREKKNMRIKVSKLEEKEIAKHYRKELKKMESDPNYHPISYQ